MFNKNDILNKLYIIERNGGLMYGTVFDITFFFRTLSIDKIVNETRRFGSRFPSSGKENT